MGVNIVRNLNLNYLGVAIKTLVRKNPDYKEKGTVEKVGDLDIYSVGQGPKCIIWNYDIFGFDSGRSRQMCDLVADAGYLVIMPDYYRGTWCNPMTDGDKLPAFAKEKTVWNNLKNDWEQKIQPLAEKKGAQYYGTVGTCWGSYMVLRLCENVDFKAGVSFHPSHSPISGLLGESEEEILKNVKCPQIFMPAEGDHENTYPGGLGKKVLGDSLEIVTFPDMKHGWTTRRDMSDPKVDRDVKKALNLALGFFTKYMK